MDYRNTALENTVEKVIEFCFPGIKDLKVFSNDRMLSIIFSEGQYSKEEVENKLEEIKNEINSPPDISGFNKTDFGFVIQK